MALDLSTILMINAFFLLAVLVILVVLAALRPWKEPNEDEWEVEKDLKTIKNQIENEAKVEAEEELMPNKPPRLKEPRKRRL